MTNPQRGDVELKLGDKTYTLRPTFDAIAKIEARTGLGVMPLARKFFNTDYGLRDAAIVIEEGIKGAGAEVPQNIGNIIRSFGLSNLDLNASLTTFFAYAVNGDEKGEKTRDRVARDKADQEKKGAGEA